MVDVKLAGFSTPVKILEEMKKLYNSIKEGSADVKNVQTRLENMIGWFTPEPIAAAWARISRDPEDINKLLENALEDVPKARKSNETIIHKMGHHAAAQNAMFHFNITNASRLVIEDIEKRRLAGYLEKSQRYVTLDGDFVRPAEFSPEDLAKFEKLVALQNECYFRTNEKILEILKNRNAARLSSADDKARKALLGLLEGSAKEDARYALSLATKAQLGVSYDGETLEHAIRTLKYGRLAEERELAKKLFDQSAECAPSLIQLADAEIFRQKNPGQELDDNSYYNTRKRIRDVVEQAFTAYGAQIFEGPPAVVFNSLNRIQRNNVTLMPAEDIDLKNIAALLHQNSQKDLLACYLLAGHLLHANNAAEFIDNALVHIGPHDKLPRAFENNDLVYQVVISSSGFGQLKRHRMMTLLAQDYDTSLAYEIPQNVEDAGAAKELKEVCDKSTALHDEFKPRYGKAAEYCLTNAHKRRTLVGINIRQLHHFSRTREDMHAQWEIRGIAGDMCALAKEVAPISTRLLGGKDKFPEIHRGIYWK